MAEKQKRLTLSEWRELKIKYITGNYTIGDLATYSGISSAAVSRRCTVEDWDAERELYKKEFEKRAFEQEMALGIEYYNQRNKKHQILTEQILLMQESDTLAQKMDIKKADMYLKMINTIKVGQEIERKCFGVDKAEAINAEQVVEAINKFKKDIQLDKTAVEDLFVDEGEDNV